MNNAPILSLHGVTVRRGRQPAVRGVELALTTGQRGRVSGVNGSGKTSLALGICGQLPVEGELRRPQRVGFAPQEPRFPRHLAVDRYLAALTALGGTPRSAARRAVERSLGAFELRDQARRTIGDLSRGWRQRLNLARAWLDEPELLVLDEPQTALDPAGMEMLRSRLDAFAGAALVLAPPGTGCDALAPLVCELVA